jgi:hypothetical protein
VAPRSFARKPRPRHTGYARRDLTARFTNGEAGPVNACGFARGPNSNSASFGNSAPQVAYAGKCIGGPRLDAWPSRASPHRGTTRPRRAARLRHVRAAATMRVRIARGRNRRAISSNNRTTIRNNRPAARNIDIPNQRGRNNAAAGDFVDGQGGALPSHAASGSPC